MTRSEHGQALPIAAFFACAMMAVALLVGYVGKAANVNAQVQTAADAAALAGVQGGEKAAETAAKANGARLESLAREGSDAIAEVRIGDSAATARARLTGGLPTASD